jgi:succinyl-CoA synthetase beta subunit
LFLEHDLALLEVNPLVVKLTAICICLDAKLNIDANAMYRQPKLKTFHDPSQEDDPREAHAATVRTELRSSGRQHRLHG